MTFIAVRCPPCQSDQIVQRGKTARGAQRYLCQNTRCTKGSFLLDYCNRGGLPEVKQTIIDMSLNASGVRDTARSLPICREWTRREGGRDELRHPRELPAYRHRNDIPGPGHSLTAGAQKSGRTSRGCTFIPSARAAA
jgi:transposase-like protein